MVSRGKDEGEVRENQKWNENSKDDWNSISEYQNGPSEVNGHDGDEKEQPVRACDIVQITGKAENCEVAKNMLLDTIPVTHEVYYAMIIL